LGKVGELVAADRDIPTTLGRDEWLSRLGTRLKPKCVPKPKAPREGVSTFHGQLTAIALKRILAGPDAEPAGNEAAWHAQVGCLLDAGFSVTPDYWIGDHLHVTINIDREWNLGVEGACGACFSKLDGLPIEGA
jgi:hypothetical protein